MKLKNIYKGMMVGVLALGLSSCQDFLNRPAEDNYNTSNFYLNDEQCVQGVNYLYNSPWYDFQRAFINVGEIMSGNIYANGTETKSYHELTTNSTDKHLVNMSYSLWAVNGHANTVIQNIVRSEGPSQEVKNQCIGEALTLKALAYFFMVRSFGEVPIIHDNFEVLSSGKYNEAKKATKANIYEYIIVNLEKAMELLPKKTSGWDGRIDYYAAEGLLAKTYLTKAGVTGTLNNDDLVKAAQYAKDVIDNSGRTLTPKFSDIFRLAPATYNQTGEPMISWLWAAGRDPWTQQNTLQSDLMGEGFSETGDLWGGWGGPSYDLMMAFGVDPLVDPRERASSEKDTRRKSTIMMAGDEYEYFWRDKGGFDLLRYIYDDEYGKGGPDQFQGPCGGQNCKHLYGNIADHEAETGLTPGNMCYQLPTHILRLGDVYLVYAEASLLSGNKTDALAYVNKIRERAGADLLSSVTIQDVWKERRLELAGEGDYWYDFVRRSYYAMDEAIAELKAQKRNEVYSYDAVCSDYFEGAEVGKDGKMDYSACEWTIDPSVTLYNDTTPAPNVTASVFTLPFPQEDVVFNPNLLEPAEEVDVRATYVYNF